MCWCPASSIRLYTPRTDDDDDSRHASDLYINTAPLLIFEPETIKLHIILRRHDNHDTCQRCDVLASPPADNKFELREIANDDI